MRQKTPGLTLAGIAALLLVACGGGGGSGSSSSGGTANVAPVANAGVNQAVTSSVLVTLNGTASSDSDGTIAGYAWTQTVGTAVTLTGGTTSQPTFTAPVVLAATTLTFSLVVTDNRGAASAAATVNVVVNPVAIGNIVPVANAGTNQTVTSAAIVTLNGTASSDPDGTIASYAWTQTVGTAVTLTNATTSQPTFTAPVVVAATTLTFSLIVTDNRAATSPAATVNVTVNPVVVGNGTITGRVTFARVPFSGSSPFGLNYASPVQQPARGVIVQALAAGTANVLATGTTDALGNYSLTVTPNIMVTVNVVARMLRDTSQALPRWDVRAQDGVAGTTYAYTDGVSFNSNAGTAHDVAIPTGINASGVATGARASGPFAALDTIYQGMQTIVGVAPTTDFPALIVDWGSQTDGTFFDPNGSPRIALLADLTEDTDEFDQHVVAHEFGHYIERNFSRADNIGGSHGLGDKLDPRVAFGEGFGYAFAAIVLNDPIARDSFVNGATQVSGSFNVETNPPTSPPGTPNGNFGCWCSESSVWSILWDVYDNPADANDTLALGFQPIWDVLIGPQRTTPAFTTIFSFITALRTQNPGSATAIDTLVFAQNINSMNIDAYGSNESHVPLPLLASPTLPIYTLATISGGAVVVGTSDDAGTSNKLGNRRFIRFNVPTTRTITISASSSNPNNSDTDFLVFRAGTFVRAGTSGPAENPEVETFSALAGEYVLDLYDCANGCDPSEGTPGDYNLTVTIN
jgi:hypothetical protein